jgi:hypothetical protein
MKRNKLISDWPCSWEEHELVELRNGMHESFRSKLEWLESASDFAQKMLHARHVPAPTAAKNGPAAVPSAKLNPPDTAADSA